VFNLIPRAPRRYFVSAADQVIALLYSAPSAWKTSLHLIVNNARFLIVPWASREESRFSHRRPKQPMHITGIARGARLTPYSQLLQKTFVEKPRFNGACYKGANWEDQEIFKGEANLIDTSSMPRW